MWVFFKSLIPKAILYFGNIHKIVTEIDILGIDFNRETQYCEFSGCKAEKATW